MTTTIDDTEAPAIKHGGPEKCPKPCVDCEGERHHWIEVVPDLDNPDNAAQVAMVAAGVIAGYACKHCDAWTEELDEADEAAMAESLAAPETYKPLKWEDKGEANWAANNTADVHCPDAVDYESAAFFWIGPDDLDNLSGKYDVSESDAVLLTGGTNLHDTLEAAQAWCEARNRALWDEKHPAAIVTLKALSLWQPWASLIAIGAKRIETRSWSTDYRGPVAIHASKHWTDKESVLVTTEPFATALRAHVSLPFGAIVAVADLVDCLPTITEGFDSVTVESSDGSCIIIPPAEPERSFGNYAPNRFAWVLTNVRALPTPIWCAGHQKLYNLPADIAERVLAQLTAPEGKSADEKQEAEPPKPAAKVGSADIEEDDGRPDADAWADIQDAFNEYRKAEAEVESLQLRLKDAKKHQDAADVRFKKLVEDSESGQRRLKFPKGKPAEPVAEEATAPATEARGPLLWTCQAIGQWTAPSSVTNAQGIAKLYCAGQKEDKWAIDVSVSSLLPDPIPGPFDSLEAAQAACQALEDARFAPPVECAKPCENMQDPNQDAKALEEWESAWRAQKISELSPPLKPGKLKALAAHAPPIVTMGDMSDHQAKAGDWWAKEIKNFGDVGQQQYVLATDAYWSEHPQPKPGTPFTPMAPAEIATGLNQSVVDDLKAAAPSNAITEPATLESLKLAPGSVAAACHSDLLARLQCGSESYEVRTLTIDGDDYVVTPSPAGSGDDFYALRSLHDLPKLMPKLDAELPYHGLIVLVGGAKRMIGPDALLVADLGF